MVIFKNFVRYISVSITIKVFIDFALIPLKIKYYSILQKRPSRMLDIYTPCNEVRVGGYTGITLSVRLSVCLSVRRRARG